MTPAEIDRFIRTGRIGPALIAVENRLGIKDLTLEACTFSVRRIGGYVSVVLRLSKGQERKYRVGGLHVFLHGPSDLNTEERAFFRPFGY
jgi:hypothetical protein